MADFDLIPEDYKYWQWQRSCIKRTGIFLLLCLAFVLALSAYLHTSMQMQNAVVMDLQRQVAISGIQQDKIASLLEKQQSLQAHSVLLQGLRGGARVDSILATVDEALRGDDVWFLNWEFQRLGQKFVRSSATPGNSYLTDIAKHLESGPPGSWKIDTQVSITGQARDYSAFSEFIQRLTSGSEVLEVKIARTSLATINDVDIVEFNIQVLINNNPVMNSG